MTKRYGIPMDNGMIAIFEEVDGEMNIYFVEVDDDKVVLCPDGQRGSD